MIDREDNEKKYFEDEQGDQPYDTEELLLDRGVITTPYDAPVRTLIDEIAEKQLIVNPPFQRQSVWRRDRQSKLIESLLLNIPIPVLYFAEDDDGTRVVVDGQQRLRAIEEFRSGQYSLRKLEMLSQLNGKRWTDLTPKQVRTIQTRTLRCVVISSVSPPTLRFEMFERLNTGGVPLNDQELRNCVFRGSLNEFLNELVYYQPWLNLINREEPDYRMRHQELILRFFALKAVVGNYRPPLKGVLNNFMRSNREVSEEQKQRLRTQFENTLTNVGTVFGQHPFKRINATDSGRDVWDTNLNRAVFDIQMLGFVGIPNEEVEERKEAILDRFRNLCLENTEFLATVSLATADRNRFYTRLRIWGESLVAEGLEPKYLSVLPST